MKLFNRANEAADETIRSQAREIVELRRQLAQQEREALQTLTAVVAAAGGRVDVGISILDDFPSYELITDKSFDTQQQHFVARRRRPRAPLTYEVAQ